MEGKYCTRRVAAQYYAVREIGIRGEACEGAAVNIAASYWIEGPWHLAEGSHEKIAHCYSAVRAWSGKGRDVDSTLSVAPVLPSVMFQSATMKTDTSRLLWIRHRLNSFILM